MTSLLAGHSFELFLLFVVCTIAVSAHGYWHAKHYWEGLPPRIDALVSAAGFVAIVGAFVFGGRLGSGFDHPHAARLLAVAIIAILYRAVRTWIGLRYTGEQPPR